MNKELLKNIGIYALIVAFFLTISYAFVPQVLSGKIVNQSDISGWKGMAEESVMWNAAHPDDKTAWTDSMFGGMPNVTFIEDFEGDWTKPLYKALLWGKRPASYLFLALIGAFLMMLAMGINRYLAVIGAIAVAFCAYNFQIIQVGHNTKMQAIAFAPWVIAALVYTYRKTFQEKKLLSPHTLMGSALFALALSFQIKANHVQITYYLAIVVLLYILASFIWILASRRKELLLPFVCTSALLLVLGLAGIGTNANKLLPTYEYTPFTMRGGSELSKEGANKDGLDLAYATAWSYGIEETPNMMIANLNGGSSSGALSEKSATYQLFKRAGQNAKQICKALPLYWGPQPFTAGPMYIGAISIFLFILGLCVLEGREKWWLLVCCVLAIMLAWGNHLMWFTELCFKYAPMYNKFRTVSMALVILQFCVPLGGIYALDRIMKQDIAQRKVVRGVWISMAVTAGFCALCALVPSFVGDFTADGDAQIQDIIADTLRQDRRHLMQMDAWRSFLLIVVSAGAIMWCYLKPGSAVGGGRMRIAAGLIGLLVFFDMWSMGKRYLNDGHFITPKDFSAQFNERAVDKIILEDQDPSYRVLDLSQNTFNSSVTSFRHKSIGGYSPTKMQRYQDLIDHYLIPEINTLYSSLGGCETISDMQENMPFMPVVSMLNGRYIILDGNYPPLVNLDSNGEAWFVDTLVTAEDADSEIALLGQVDLLSQAVVRSTSFEAEGTDPDAVICMTSYAPNCVKYRYSSAVSSAAVFSEIYHPSWKAVLRSDDGKETELELFQADWVLRGAILPPGSGEITMRYEPQDYKTGARISLICSIILLLAIAGCAIGVRPRAGV